MRSLAEIYDISANRKGGSDALEGLLTPADPGQANQSDDRWLSTFSKHIFNAGFNWKVVDTKWPGFEEAFKGFDPGRVAMMDDEWFDSLLTDTRIVRHGPKIRAVQENAVFFTEAAAEFGSVTKMIADWPLEDYIGLLDLLKSRGTRLGGNTGQYALRFGGKDSFVLGRDVVARLIAEGVVDKPPTSKTAMRKVQDAFNTWHEESGAGLTRISRILAFSVGD